MVKNLMFLLSICLVSCLSTDAQAQHCGSNNVSGNHCGTTYSSRGLNSYSLCRRSGYIGSIGQSRYGHKTTSGIWPTNYLGQDRSWRFKGGGRMIIRWNSPKIVYTSSQMRHVLGHRSAHHYRRYPWVRRIWRNHRRY